MHVNSMTEVPPQSTDWLWQQLTLNYCHVTVAFVDLLSPHGVPPLSPAHRAAKRAAPVDREPAAPTGG